MTWWQAWLIVGEVIVLERLFDPELGEELEDVRVLFGHSEREMFAAVTACVAVTILLWPVFLTKRL